VTLSRQHEQTSCKQGSSFVTTCFLKNPPQDHVDLWLFSISASLYWHLSFCTNCFSSIRDPRVLLTTRRHFPKGSQAVRLFSADNVSGRYSDLASFAWLFVSYDELSALSLSIYLPLFVFLVHLPPPSSLGVERRISDAVIPCTPTDATV
jgi:hypothetical protein